MAHGNTKITVPIGAMNPVPSVKIHGVGNIGQIVIVATHGSGNVFDINSILSRHGDGGPAAGRDHHPMYRRLTLISNKQLLR